MGLSSISCFLLYQYGDLTLASPLNASLPVYFLLLIPCFRPSFSFFHTVLSGLAVTFRLVTSSIGLTIISLLKPSQSRPTNFSSSLVCFVHIKFLKIPSYTINFNIFTFCLSFASDITKVLFYIYFFPIGQSYSWFKVLCRQILYTTFATPCHMSRIHCLFSTFPEHLSPISITNIH